jgi:hypothetical protein
MEAACLKHLKCWWVPTKLHSVRTQKVTILIFTAVKASNLISVAFVTVKFLLYLTKQSSPLASVGQTRNACSIFVRKFEGKGPLRRCRHRWEEIKKGMDVK